RSEGSILHAKSGPMAKQRTILIGQFSGRRGNFRPDNGVNMLIYIARRAAFAVFLVFAVSSAALVLARLAPGDYVTTSLGIDARRETIEQARVRYEIGRASCRERR